MNFKMKISLVHHKQFEKLFHIKFDKPITRLHSNGFMSVTVDWRCKKKAESCGRFKYVSLSHKTYGGSYSISNKKYINAVSASLEFGDLSAQDSDGLTPPWFDVSLGADNDYEVDNNQYDFIFLENTKYGVILWFAPKQWEEWDKAVELKNKNN